MPGTALSFDRRLVVLLEAVEDPVSIATAIRDREGRILGAIRLGDGYLSTGRLRAATSRPA